MAARRIQFCDTADYKSALRHHQTFIRLPVNPETVSLDQQFMNPSPTPIRVAIVEDRAQDRESLVELLRSDAGLECVAACRSASEALEMLPRCQPDIVLMDIQLPGPSGIDCLRELHPLLPNAQFMM